MSDTTLETKKDLLKKLNSYVATPDDDVIKFKEKIKTALLQSPELLYTLNYDEYKDELFNKDGTINYEGDWSQYFGYAIRPYLFIPEVQSDAKNFLCYNVSFKEAPRYNKIEYYCQIKFIALCHGDTAVDKLTGIARHDLMASIIRERFNWSNIFGTQCKLESNVESVTDSKYTTRTLVFQLTLPNSYSKTINGETRVVNNEVHL